MDADYSSSSSSSCGRKRASIGLKQFGFTRGAIMPVSVPTPPHPYVRRATNRAKRAWSVKLPLSHNELTPGLHSSSMLWSATVPLAAAARDKRERQRVGKSRNAWAMASSSEWYARKSRPGWRARTNGRQTGAQGIRTRYSEKGPGVGAVQKGSPIDGVNAH